MTELSGPDIARDVTQLIKDLKAFDRPVEGTAGRLEVKELAHYMAVNQLWFRSAFEREYEGIKELLTIFNKPDTLLSELAKKDAAAAEKVKRL